MFLNKNDIYKVHCVVDGTDPKELYMKVFYTHLGGRLFQWCVEYDTDNWQTTVSRHEVIS